ncbi:MAG: acyltransferase [Candidatus Saccharibacteria bacterium]|nr:acyltransferase [Candidatus Saccharibacteria bacterium]
MKKIIKNIIYAFYCRFYRVKQGKNGSISIPFKVVNYEGGEMIIGDDIDLSPGSLFMLLKPGAKISIGNRVRAARYFQINCAFDIQIGNNVNIGPYVFLGDHNHKYEDIEIPIRDQSIDMSKRNRISIGDDTWIGTKASIIGNVKIGKHCIIGANSVVSKDIPDYCVAAGIPAKVIKKYNFGTKEWERV